MSQAGQHALLNTTVGNVGKKAEWKYNAPPDEALFSERHRVRLAVNVCFIMGGASKRAPVHITSHFANLTTLPCSADQLEAYFLCCAREGPLRGG